MVSLTVTDSVADVRNVPGWENGVDVSMANGFRFGNAVLPGSAITLRDLYTWFPIAPAVNIADFSGQSIQNSLNTILGAVFDRNVFMQRGGWYLGLANMEQKIDLKNRPFSSSGGRVVETKIGGQPWILANVMSLLPVTDTAIRWMKSAVPAVVPITSSSS